MLDHAIDYDWSSAGLLLGSKNDIQLSEEQKNLLYGPETVAGATGAGAKPPIVAEEEQPGTSGEEASLFKGWGKRNLLSERAAWVRVRHRENRPQRSNQVVGGGLLTLPGGTTAPPPAATSLLPPEFKILFSCCKDGMVKNGYVFQTWRPRFVFICFICFCVLY